MSSVLWMCAARTTWPSPSQVTRVCFLVQLWLPDSPRWLLLNGASRDKAEAALVRARGKFGADAERIRGEFSAIARSVTEAQGGEDPGRTSTRADLLFPQNGLLHPSSLHTVCLSTGLSGLTLKQSPAHSVSINEGEHCNPAEITMIWCGAGFFGLFRGRFLKPLVIGSSLMLFQQITGQPSVLYYAAEIFEKAGFGAGKDATGVSVVLGFFKLIMTGVLSCSADTLKHGELIIVLRIAALCELERAA